MKQRYFKLLTNGSYADAVIGSTFPLVTTSSNGSLAYLQTDFYSDPLSFYIGTEVEEVFNCNANIEQVADLVFNNKTNLDNYDASLSNETSIPTNDEIDVYVDKYMEAMESKTSSKRVFSSGSMRDNDDNKPLPFELHPYMLLRYGYHMKTGSLNYGKGNWEKTQPDVDVWDSGGRHFAQAMLCFKDPGLAKELGLDQEDHLSALLFFVNMLMMNEAKRGIKPNHYFKGKTK